MVTIFYYYYYYSDRHIRQTAGNVKTMVAELAKQDSLYK